MNKGRTRTTQSLRLSRKGASLTVMGKRCPSLRDRAKALLISMDVDATGYVQELRGFRHFSYGEICAALNDRFGAARTVSADKLASRSCRKEPEESYAHLAQDIRRLARRVYRGATALAEEEARDALLRALPDGMMRCMVTAANPLTLTECEENVTQLHAVLSQKPPAKVRMVKQGYQGLGMPSKGTGAQEGEVKGTSRDQRGMTPRIPSVGIVGKRGTCEPDAPTISGIGPSGGLKGMNVRATKKKR